MLSAEHIALQSRLVQQLVAVRQREMDAILKRYDALGTQASLLAGFAITSLTALTSVSDPTAVNRVVCHTFFATSVCCLLSCLHVIICTMYTCNWAPALALRGPSGSLTRAYKAVRGEKNQINAFFTVGIISFAVQTVCAVWILDETPKWTYDSIAATAILGLAGVVIFWYHRRMHGRFFGDSAKLLDVDSDAVAAAAAEEAAPAPAPSSTALKPINSGGFFSRFGGSAATSHTTAPLVAADAPTSSTAPPRARASARRPSCTTLLDNPVALVDSHPDIANDDTAAAAASTSGDFAMRGLLYKRVAAASARRRLASAVTSEWRERFFVLSGGHLQYWRSEADYEAGKAGALDNPIDLRGFEVLCDMADPRWGFALQPIEQNGARAWSLRAPTEEARLEWARKLVVATLMRS